MCGNPCSWTLPRAGWEGIMGDTKIVGKGLASGFQSLSFPRVSCHPDSLPCQWNPISNQAEGNTEGGELQTQALAWVGVGVGSGCGGVVNGPVDSECGLRY